MSEFFTALVANTMPRISTRMPPAEPMRLMTAFALLRSGFMVTSGMSATAGERNVAIESSTTSSSPTNRIRVPGWERVVWCAQACRAGTT